MISKPFWVIFFYFFLILFIPSNSFPQLKWNLNGEAGVFKSSGIGIFNYQNLLTRFEGFLKYKFDSPERNASLSLRVRPEFYNTEVPVNSIKFKAEGEYYQSEEKFNWGLNVTRQINFFNYESYDLTYDIFTLTGNSVLFFLDNMPVNLNTGYAYQVIKNDEDYNLDLFLIDLTFFNKLVPNLNFGYGIYLEKFFIINNVVSNLGNLDVENNGWRYGPQISLNYIKDFIINIDYKFIIHNSEFTRNLSSEHLVRLVAGKILFADWSAFILVDYNTLSIKKTINYIAGITPLYTPLNLENRIFIKLAYEINNNLEIYSRAGYFKDNLYEDRLTLEGWNAMLGIELSGGM
jgi:hypothetical protein